MSPHRALEIVLELAEQNMADPVDLPEAYQEQLEAICIVTNILLYD